jgi:hypothetical protein
MSTVSVANTDAGLSAKTLALIGSANAGNLLFTDATYDIGQSGATRPRDLFLSRNAVIGGTLSVAGNFSATTILTGVLSASTSDGSDNASVAAAGGGAVGASRGGSITVGGNEHASQPGYVLAQIGNVANSKLSVQRGDNTEVVNISGADGITALRFAATQVSSANVNTLDDYEEGTWTPVIGGAGGTSGQTYTIQIGEYTKIGKIVRVSFQALLSAKGTITGAVQIQGLPFQSDNNNLYSVGALQWSGLATTWVNVIWLVQPSVTAAAVTGTTAAATGNNTALGTADIGNTTLLIGSLTYQASA